MHTVSVTVKYIQVHRYRNPILYSDYVLFDRVSFAERAYVYSRCNGLHFCKLFQDSFKHMSNMCVYIFTVYTFNHFSNEE